MYSGPPADPAAPGTAPGPTAPPGSPPAVAAPAPAADAPFADRISDASFSGEMSDGPTVRPAGRSWTTPLLLCAAGALALLVALLGPGIAARGTGELRIPGAGLTTVLRTVLFTALALHLGELLGPQLVRPVRGRPRTAVRSWAVLASLAGAAAAAGQIVRLAAVSDLGITETYGTREGGLLLLIANGLVLAALCAASKRPALALAPLAVARSGPRRCSWRVRRPPLGQQAPISPGRGRDRRRCPDQSPPGRRAAVARVLRRYPRQGSSC
ncbi:hypothetical protein SFIMM107S_06604 [Streptomyces griseus]